MRKPTFGDLLFILLVGWCIAGTAFVAHAAYGRVRPHARIDDLTGWTRVDDWSSVGSQGHLLEATGGGPGDHSVVVFSDFQCPYCQRFSLVVDSLRRKFPNVRVIERNFPLASLHDESVEAAIAGECANDMHHYEQMRRAMFQKRGLVEDGDWGLLAHRAGITDTAFVADCVQEHRDMDRINADISAGKGIGLRGTPGVLVDGYMHQGAVSLADLEARLRIRAAGSKTQ